MDSSGGPGVMRRGSGWHDFGGPLLIQQVLSNPSFVKATCWAKGMVTV